MYLTSQSLCYRHNEGWIRAISRNQNITATTKQHQTANQKTCNTQRAGSVSLEQLKLKCFAQVDSGEEKHSKSSDNEALLLGFEPATFKLSELIIIHVTLKNKGFLGVGFHRTILAS